ncbi:tubulin polyglutamylase TTLL5-like isoform X3 [Styela clava]
MPVTSEVTSDYSGSLTPTSSEEESEEEEEDAHGKKVSESSSLLWSGTGAKRIAFIMFRPESLIARDKRLKSIGEKYHLAYKMVKTESKLVRSVLSTYGFHEVHPNSPDFNLMWTGAHLKPFSLRTLQDFQKVNHFPRSYEITRKDRLFKNIDRMAHTKGAKHFDFMPKSYLMPSEYQDFCAAYVKDKGPWIVKPIASSRGRGIYLINNPNQVPLEDNIMVCKYIANPLLIDSFKFDIRVYIAVTSYDPLMIYLFEEGLTRFATVKYEKTHRHLKNQMMHLTNYSINKKSHDYVRCEDPDVEDYGNKWSMSAMLRYLKQEGIDTNALMMRIEAVIIKAIIAAELPIATACKMFVPNRENCMELYGFDILVDENLKPWLLEGNLSPSLACDAPLDLKIKSCMISDFFSLVGFQCVDPLTRRQKKDQMRRPYSAKGLSGATPMQGMQSKRPVSASGPKEPGVSGLSNEEAKVLRIAKEQYQRRGSFIRIFPTPETWELYGSFLEYKSNLNFVLAQKLFPERVKSKASSGVYSTAVARMRSIAAGQMLESRNRVMTERFMQYERKLLSLESLKNKKTKKAVSRKKSKDTPIGVDNKSLAQGQLKKSSRSTARQSDDSEEEDDTDSADDSETERTTKKEISKPTHKLSTSATSSVKSSTKASTSQKQKNTVAQKPAITGGGGDLNPLTKSAYASARNSTSAKSQVKQSASSLTSSSKTSMSSKSSSGKNDKKTKNSNDTVITRQQGQSQRVYTYKNVEKITDEGGGDAKSCATPDNQPVSDSDDSTDSSSDENDEQAVTPKPRQPQNKSLSTIKHGTVNANSPRTKQQKKTLDVLHALKSGGNLGKVQARQAFSAYLSRVQQRLMAESESHSQPNAETVTKQEEQMDLVLRFLKRAAGNLKQSFAVVMPSRRLCLPDRKRILAKQLGDFVHIYNKETDTMEQKQSLGLEKEAVDAWTESVQEISRIRDSDFRFFVLSASEAELEEVLTTYTHKNKSASVFLGASKPKSREKREISTPATMATATSTSTLLQSRNRLTTIDTLPSQPLVQTGKMYQSEEHREDLYELNLHRRSQSAYSSFRMRSPSPASSVASLSSRPVTVSSHSHHGPPHPSAAYLNQIQKPNSAVSSLQQAAYVYSSKLTPPSSVLNVTTNQQSNQKRPSSARDFNPVSQSNSQSNHSNSRPVSAATGNANSLGGSLHYQTAANEEAIADALQKLAERQAARQYSATSQLQALTQHLSNINLANMSAARRQAVQQQHNLGSQRASSLSDLAATDPSVQSMMENGVWDADAGTLSGANKYRNINPAGQSQALAEQSKELLQESKAKHQAMVAQVIDGWRGETDIEVNNAENFYNEESFISSGVQCIEPQRRNFLDSLMCGWDEEECEGTTEDQCSKLCRIETVSAYRWESPRNNSPEKSLFYYRLVESYVPLKYSVTKFCPCSKKAVDDSKASLPSSSEKGSLTEDCRPKVKSCINHDCKDMNEKDLVKGNGSMPIFDHKRQIRPKSRVENVWNSYHKTGSNSSNPSAKSSKSLKKNSRESSDKSSNELSLDTSSSTMVYKNALDWAKTGDNHTVQNAISGIKGMFEAGELPCKRWRYQNSCAGSIRTAESCRKNKKEVVNSNKERKATQEKTVKRKAHNMVSMGVDAKSQHSYMRTDDSYSLRHRPNSASSIAHKLSSSANASTNNSSRPPQVPRPPEKPKPVERVVPTVRKQLGNTKITRTGSHPMLTGLSPNPSTMTVNDDSLQLDFYNSFKYDNSTGSTRIVEKPQEYHTVGNTNGAVNVVSRPSSAKRPTWKP